MAQFRDHHRTAAGLYGAAVALDATLDSARRERNRYRRAAGAPSDLGSIAIGTTGTCNASCIHCPTGKASTAHVPRGTMPMPLFRKLIDGLVDDGLRIDGQISFGLFGDGLVDPLVVERARIARAALPDTLLSVNTNGAAYNAGRHAALAPLISLISLHCESLVPATYDHLMTPLRAKNVFPKYEAILAAFPGKVRVSVPVSRLNIAELHDMRAWFETRGALEVVFDPMSSRCVEDRALFDDLSLGAHPIRCAPVVMRDLIIDCDGLVLSCCQDFAREVPIGDLAAQDFRTMLADPRRARFEAQLATGRHAEIATCNRCHGDLRTPDFPFDQVAA